MILLVKSILDRGKLLDTLLGPLFNEAYRFVLRPSP